jgi:hypothetical protein
MAKRLTDRERARKYAERVWLPYLDREAVDWIALAYLAGLRAGRREAKREKTND